jgi:DNA polymerase-3 subunit delta'
MSAEQSGARFGAGIEAQASALAVLEHALQRGRGAQAYLFAGPDGVGKQRAALALARARLCPSAPLVGCGTCETCTRIDRGLHPDVRVFSPRDEGDRNLQVEYLRNEVLPLAKFAPFEADATFFVFPEADVSFPPQHAEAANAMLKTLEEPRSRVHFVLLSSRPDRLLSTIRSRCQRVRFAGLPPRVLERVLQAAEAEPAAKQLAIALCQGRADRALALAKEGHASALLGWVERIDSVLSGHVGSEALAVSEELARSDQLEGVLEALMLFYREVALQSLPDAQPSRAFPASRVSARAAQLGARGAAEVVSLLIELEQHLQRNANPQLALDGFLLNLSA